MFQICTGAATPQLSFKPCLPGALGAALGCQKLGLGSVELNVAEEAGGPHLTQTTKLSLGWGSHGRPCSAATRYVAAQV